MFSDEEGITATALSACLVGVLVCIIVNGVLVFTCRRSILASLSCAYSNVTWLGLSIGPKWTLVMSKEERFHVYVVPYDHTSTV